GAGETLDYVAQFLSGIALSTRDDALWDAAEALTRERGCGGDGSAPVARISGLVQARLTEAEAF
ncbi:MAG: response regulator, partial [Defluviimonas sp.]|nr:response regulator [Defluviimonas sp.]